MSSAVLIMVLAVVVVLALPANLVPYFRSGPRLRTVPWLYFFCIGVAFMAVEIVLIQQYSLLIGSSIYCVATVLLTLLLASGLGSRRAVVASDRTVFLFIAAWLVLDALFFGLVATWCGAFPQFPRMVVSAVLIFPLGYFMGMPFPKGALRVGELIDWGFSVNGAASVLGSVLVLMVSFAWGFSLALIFAAAVYLIAFALIGNHRAWVAQEPQSRAASE